MNDEAYSTPVYFKNGINRFISIRLFQMFRLNYLMTLCYYIEIAGPDDRKQIDLNIESDLIYSRETQE